MIKNCLLYVFSFLAFVGHAQERKSVILPTDSFLFSTDTAYRADSVAMDSVIHLNQHQKRYSLMDTLNNDTLLKAMMAPYHLIRNFYVEKPHQRINIPTIKEIGQRPSKHGSWKFWIICFILLYISFVRIANQNNFRVFLQSVFNLKLSEKIWEEQRSVFNFVILQLFAIYLFIAALFINYFLEIKLINPFHNYFTQYLVIVGVLILVYLSKFIIHSLLGVLLKMNRLGVGFVANTVSVNNFLSLIILPFIIFIIYNEDRLFTVILTQTVIAIFFIGVFYRMIRIAVLSHTFFSFPKVYLFIYLCALEVAPWFVIIKFINQFQI